MLRLATCQAPTPASVTEAQARVRYTLIHGHAKGHLTLPRRGRRLSLGAAIVSLMRSTGRIMERALARIGGVAWGARQG
jgi:hypothetical protein